MLTIKQIYDNLETFSDDKRARYLKELLNKLTPLSREFLKFTMGI